MHAPYPVSKPVRTTAPDFANEPVTLEEARRQCAIDGNDWDESLKDWIVAARELVEKDTGLVFYAGEFTWKLTYFPAGDVLELPDIWPITAVGSIAYINSAGDSATFDSEDYALQTGGIMQFVRLNYGELWPTVRGDINGITVTFTAGYADVKDSPRRGKQAVLLLVNHWYETRGIVSPGTISPGVEMTYDALVESLRRWTYA